MNPPRPAPCDISSFTGFPTGPWPVTHSSLGKLFRVVTARWAVGPAQFALFVCAWDPLSCLLGLWPELQGCPPLACLLSHGPTCIASLCVSGAQ